MTKEIIYKLNHIDLLCGNMEQTIHTYQNQLGMQMTSRSFALGQLDISCFGLGSDAVLQMIGSPFLPHEETSIAKNGCRLHHFCFLVEDAAAAHQDLLSKGVQVAWEPQKSGNYFQGGYYDDDGLLFVVFSVLDPAAPWPISDRPAGPSDLRLEHLSILTPDLERSRRFYCEKLGMKTVLEYLPDGGGFIYVLDPMFDGKKHILKLEIIGPPGLEPREQVLMNRYGACIDHIAFVTDDVQGAYEQVLKRGATDNTAPVFNYGVWMAWVNDPDGNDIEIKTPRQDDLLLEALRSSRPINLLET